MDTTLPRAATPLRKGALLRLQHARGRAVAVFSGCLWVTQEGDLQDVTLGAGDSFSFDRDGLTMAQALEDTSLILFDLPAQEPRPRRPSAEPPHRQARRTRAAAIGDAAARFVSRLRLS